MVFEKNHEENLKSSFVSCVTFACRVGVEFTSSILVGLVLGYAIDHFFNTKPWGIVFMVVLGACAGLLSLFRMFSLGKPFRNFKTFFRKKR